MTDILMYKGINKNWIYSYTSGEQIYYRPVTDSGVDDRSTMTKDCLDLLVEEGIFEIKLRKDIV